MIGSGRGDRMETGQQWPVVFRTVDQVEAEFIRGLLETSDVPVVVEAKGLKSMTTFFGHSANGELLIKVPPDREDFALQLLAAPSDLETDE